MKQPRMNDFVQQCDHRCPICGEAFGQNAAVPTDPYRDDRFISPPPMRLEVGETPQHGGTYDEIAAAIPYRLSTLCGDYKPASSRKVTFNGRDVEYSYLLCGGGHIFPDPEAAKRLGGLRPVSNWNMFAAVGAPAVGKTYMLVRVLGQVLADLDGWGLFDGEMMTVRRCEQSPLEDEPLRSRQIMYDRTRLEQLAIPPTGVGSGTPEQLLHELHYSHAVGDAKSLVKKTTVDGERRAAEWGSKFRQPITLLTEIGEQMVWTGIADLPGEMFNPSNPRLRELRTLRGFAGLLWVVDPLLAAHALDWLPYSEQDRSAVLGGSLRPDSILDNDSTAQDVRAKRASIQTSIGERLIRPGTPLVAPVGAPLQVLVAVTKCDLIREALKKGRKLTQIGRPDVVKRGVAGYLSRVTRQHSAGQVQVGDELVGLLRYLDASTDGGHRNRCEQVADLLLDHYGNHERFWDLVHEGKSDKVDLYRSGGSCSEPIAVPDIDEHLRGALRRSTAHLLQPRDFVMSALGFGIACGTGQEHAIRGILRTEWMRPQAFLCSPLGEVPLADNARKITLKGGAFPEENERSAALTQLLLAVLQRGRIRGAED